MTPYYSRDGIEIYCGDCLEIMPQLEPVDTVITDLPYYDVVDCDWDNQWESRDDYLDWVCRLADNWKRALKDNSSIFVFCDEKMEAYIQVRLDEYFLLLNKIVWFKRNNLPQKNAHLLRSFAPMTERALFYTTQYDATGLETVKLDVNNFIPLREYFKDFQKALGLNIKQINSKLGHRKAEHAFYWNSTQWDLPTPETYQQLLDLHPSHGFIPRNYEALRRDYEALRRPFNADSKTLDVIEWPIVGGDENTDHPTTKPLGLMNRIVSVITNPGQLILDCCMGSGTTLVAAQNECRRAIGIEISEDYCRIAVDRLRQPSLFYSLPSEPQPATVTQMGIFDAE